MSSNGQPVGTGQQRNPFLSFLSPSANQIDITFYGTNVTLTAGQSLPSQINIDAGTDFYWFASSYQASIAGSAYDPTDKVPVVPLVNFVITDTGSQRNLMNTPIPVTTIAGSGQLPYRLLLPRLFKANSVVQFSWTSFETANADTINFVMHGFRLPPGANFSQFFG
jgi:hypothetical protein